MPFFIVLVVGFGVGWLLPARFGGRSTKDAARRAMAIALVFSGVSHFAMPESFSEYFPSWVPFTEAIVYGSGMAEAAGGLALFARRYRAEVGFAIAAYFVLIFPANVYVAVAGVEESLPGLPDAAWYTWARLPFQALFIWWVLRSTQTPAPSGHEARSFRLSGAAR